MAPGTSVNSWRLVVFKILTYCTIITGIYCSDKYSFWIQGRDHVDVTWEHHSTSKAMPWWKAAVSGCGEDGHLHIGAGFPRNIRDHLKEGNSYWIGATTYSTWMWSDSSAYYTYKGYRKSSERLEAKRKISDGNSVSRCHTACGSHRHLFGLRRDECYCLKTREGDENKLTDPQYLEEPCPGNYDERCGNQGGLSIYEVLAYPVIVPEEGGRCVYAEKILGYSVKFHQDKVCDTKLSSACTAESLGVTNDDRRCRGRVCVFEGMKSWQAANKSCVLIQISDSNKEDLIDAMTYDILIQEHKYRYWIGLSKAFSSRWLSGSEVLHQDITPAKASSCLSVTVTRSYDTVFEWKDCTKSLHALCVSAPTPTSTVWESTVETTGTSTTQTLEPPSTNGTTMRTDQGSTQPNIVNPMDDGDAPIGVYVGVSCGALVIVAIIITVVVVLKRTRRVCFGNKPREVTFCAENNIYMYHATPDPERHDAYSTPVNSGHSITDNDYSDASVGDTTQQQVDTDDHAQAYNHIPAGVAFYHHSSSVTQPSVSEPGTSSWHRGIDVQFYDVSQHDSPKRREGGRNNQDNITAEGYSTLNAGCKYDMYGQGYHAKARFQAGYDHVMTQASRELTEDSSSKRGEPPASAEGLNLAGLRGEVATGNVYGNKEASEDNIRNVGSPGHDTCTKVDSHTHDREVDSHTYDKEVDSRYHTEMDSDSRTMQGDNDHDRIYDNDVNTNSNLCRATADCFYENV